MQKTRIEWCDSTFNPVTGCLHNCEYCYARRIANRFGGASETHYNETVGEECQWCTEETGELHYLTDPIHDVDRGRKTPYPFYFDPTFHQYRLDEPSRKKKGQTIFVCSMADLFGKWVPDEWIERIFAVCRAAPQHRYLFLTKNPSRYSRLAASGKLPPEHWYGLTITGKEEPPDQLYSNWQTFVSIEPLLAMPDLGFLQYDNIGWVIIGAETGNRKNKVRPERVWIENIVESCRKTGTPVFMKDSLRELMGDSFVTEFPW